MRLIVAAIGGIVFSERARSFAAALLWFMTSTAAIWFTTSTRAVLLVWPARSRNRLTPTSQTQPAITASPACPRFRLRRREGFLLRLRPLPEGLTRAWVLSQT